MNPLRQLSAHGQSVWLDFIRRKLLRSGELAALIENDGLRGLTSNPAIFEKAIGGSSDYDEELGRYVALGIDDAGKLFETLAIADIRTAADLFGGVYEDSAALDGYVSLEVSPALAYDAAATIAEAHRLWNAVARPNLMIKVPGTAPCLPAVRRLIADGINVNVTLLFSRAAYRAVAQAFIDGIAERAARGQPVARVASVASFFVSRIDSAVDQDIDQRSAGGDPHAGALQRLRGKVAIANAKLAYQDYLGLFSGERWQALAGRGAQTQRLLWASTGTKNPAYPDTLYVDELIGDRTVNTMPPATMDAFRDHGTASAATLTADLDQAEAVMAAVERHAVPLEPITDRLVREGVQQFEDADRKLLQAVAAKCEALRAAAPG